MTRAVHMGTLLAIASSCACGPRLPGVFVGESSHFRLYVSPDVDVPSGLEGDNALTALETNWTDTATLLPLTAGKIEYHWVVPDDLSAACEESDSRGCEREGPIVVAVALPFQHELNHAYMELITGTNSHPLPLLTEGLAEAIGCGQGSGTLLTDPTRWQDLVTEASASFSSEGYAEGALLVRYLTRTRGADAFVAYYEQATRVRDPALFADNFQRFWGVSLDADWSAMKTVGPGESIYDNSLCPCSLPPAALDQPLGDDPATTPYWTIPDALGSTVALQGAPDHVVDDFDCLGQKFDGGGGAATSLVRLGTGVRGYVLAPLTSTATGNFVSDTCADAALYAVPAALSNLGLNVQVDRSLAPSNVVYLQLQAPPGAMAVSVPFGQTVSTCATCAFDTPACPAGTAIGAQGPTYVRLSLALALAAGSSAQVTSSVLYFQ